jgi:hypothetical protein
VSNICSSIDKISTTEASKFSPNFTLFSWDSVIRIQSVGILPLGVQSVEILLLEIQSLWIQSGGIQSVGIQSIRILSMWIHGFSQLGYVIRIESVEIMSLSVQS